MGTVYEIGPFRLDPGAGVLTHDGRPMALGARGVAVLTALVKVPNEYVRKATILDAAWPGLVVEENNLAAQISAIRRALAQVPGGEGWIETLARRGYRFVGPVAEITGRSGPPEAADRKHTNLPALLTSFIGRECEMAEIKQLLAVTRLLTLTGTGGIGKTRLAQQAAAEVLDAYRDGVWFVDLAPLRDPALVPSALAQTLQVKESPRQPLIDALCNHLHTQETLLILDNCEHVLEGCVQLMEVLLRETTQVTVLATSREPLHSAGEHTYPLAALRLPDPKAAARTIAGSDAVQLFVERARQYRPHFDLQEHRARAVAEICVRLDGIPLALELAAARVSVLPVEQIVRLLDQRFRLLTSGNRELPRHQTLGAMIDWSYELLDDAEKALFARLSVFAGGWTLAAANEVCGDAPIAKDDVVYVLLGLIERSLIVADGDGDRYRMLETMREYAKEKLVARKEARVMRQRHRDYFLALAKEAQPKLTGGEQAKWLERLDEEHDNLRSALGWSLMEEEAEGSLWLCGALQRFWLIRGHLAEGREWCARTLGKAGGKARTLEFAKVLHAAGVLAWYQADYATARARHEESLTIMRKLGDRMGIANSLGHLGIVAREQADYSVARALHEESLAIQRELGNREGIGVSLNNLGIVAYAQRDYPAARALHEESLAIMRELGNLREIARALNNLGQVTSAQGDFASARALSGESLAIRRELGDRRGIAASLNCLGNMACDQGDNSAAQVLHAECLTIMRELGDTHGIANSLEGLAEVVAALGNSGRAARIWASAARLREEIGSPQSPNDRIPYDRRVAAARARLQDDAAFDRAWREGSALPLDEAIRLALAETVEQR